MFRKTTIILLVISLVAVSLVVPACGLDIKIDGLANEKVWLECSTQVLVSNRDDSNNAVTFALASILYDEENHRVYLSFKANVDGGIIAPDETTTAPPVIGTTQAQRILHGLRISVDNSGFVDISHDGVGEYNETLYYIDAAVSEYNSSAYGVEVCLGIKLGLHTLKSISVQFVDGNGAPSNAYLLSLPLLPSEETTTAYQPAFDETVKETNERNNTTRITTTKHTTTEKTTKPEKTTVEKTTAVKTTKEKTTKLRTTKPKTTAKIVTVYVTVPENVETTLNEATVSEASGEQLQQEKTYKELKYAAAAALLILIFGLCVIINMLNDKNKSSKK